ncbi:periplasmic chaperone for outer membrane proteins SurA [Lacibacter cauensis]|uniref:Periplasmic chaperone for outer membrane proteins SurA n=1 Tax=Lacibacter cauensis TaxID=510947 RepID=A0A562SRD2_9BACT|nr:peptidylprolyl isomerase [Lacibacter cauensis]TWI83340.1 periplasmic chaperone for outer membrane proteins SurA [Lacibacter cauensis]
MKKVLTVLAVLVAFAAQAQVKKVTADKIIAVVGDRIVLKSDIDNQINDAKSKEYELPPDAPCYLMQQLVINKMLAIQAEKDSLPVSDEEIEGDLDNRIRYFIQQYGSKEVIEQITGKTIYQFREEMRDPIKENKLASAMRSKIVENVKITPTEVRAYFNKIPKDSLAFYETELEIGEIIVYPKAGREMEEYAQEELKEFKRQVEAGTKKMEFLASQYSDDPGAKENAGMYVLNRGDNQWDPTFYNTAMSLKEGQISRVIKSKFGYHIIQCLSRNGDEVTVRHILKIPRINEPDIKDAINKLDTVRAKLITGSMKFGEAVNKYSDDDNSKFTAGMMRGKDGTAIITIDELDKDMVPLLEKLKPGDYSQPVTFTDPQGKKGVRLIYLVSRTAPHRENITDDYSKIAGRALEEKKEKELQKWFLKNSKTFYVQIEDEYRSCSAIKIILGETVKN